MDNKMTVLLIEDEDAILNFMTAILNSNGYRSLTAKTAETGLSMITSYGPDLILLDLGLPDLDGLEVLRSIRQWSQIPVIVVSARGREEEKVKALDLGADDYITKPFGTAELLARMRTAFRHSHSKINGKRITAYQSGELMIDFERRLVQLAGEDIHLSRIEYKIISLLAQNTGKVLTYDFILKEVWGPYAPENNQILRVNMANIRRKIEKNPADPQYLLTEIGVGYRMMDRGGLSESE